MSINQKISAALSIFLGTFFLSARGVLGAGTVSLFSYPVPPDEQVEIGEEFTVYFKVEGFEKNTNYYMKGRVGVASPLDKGQTYNSNTSSWLNDSGDNWDEFPIFTTNSEGSASAQIKVRAKTSASLGDNAIVVRIRKVNIDPNYDSDQGMITIVAVPTSTPTPTSSSTPSPTPTPSVSSTPTPTLTLTPTPTSSSTVTPTVKPTATPTKKPTASPTPSLFPVTEEEILGVQASASLPPKTPPSLPKILIGTGTLLLVISGGLLFLPHLKR